MTPRGSKAPPDMLSEYKEEFGSLGAYLHAAVLRMRAALGGQQRAPAVVAAVMPAAVAASAAGTPAVRPMLATQASITSEPGTPTVLQQQQQQRIFLVGAQQPPH